MSNQNRDIDFQGYDEGSTGSRWGRILDAFTGLKLVKFLSHPTLGGLWGFGLANDTPLCAVDVSKGEVRLKKGTNIASAATISPAVGDGQVFHVTGVTPINTITARYSGDVIHLIADGAWSLTAAGNVKAGAGARAVNEMVTLVCDGTNWYEQRGAASTGVAIAESQVTNLVADLASKLNFADCSGARVPDAVKAANTFNGGANAVLTVTAKTAGAAGNSISLSFVDPGAPGAVLGVVVTDTVIVVNLATDGASALTADADTVRAAILAEPAAAALIDIDANVPPNGTGVMGALPDVALIGGLDLVPLTPARFYIDTANDDFYYSNLAAWVKVV